MIHELDSSEPDLDSEYIVAEYVDTRRIAFFCIIPTIESDVRILLAFRMLEGHSNPAIESPEYNSTSIVEDTNMETVHMVDGSDPLQDDVQLVNPQEVEARKKRGCKGKKK